MRASIFIATLLVAGAAMAADAPAPVKLSPTEEIFVVYEIMCVKPKGQLAAAQPAIDGLEKKDTIKALPDSDTEKLFKKGDKVWVTKTSTTKMFVVYDPVGICALHIEKADPKAIKAQFADYVDNVHKGLKDSIVIKKADDKEQEDSLFSYYIVTQAGARMGAGFGLSTSAADAKKSPQHLLTFNMAKPE